MTEIKENLEKKSEANRGLCSTCNNLPTCIFYQRNGSRIVWYCELFDDYVPVQELQKPEKKVESKTEEKSKGKLKGLCVNCEDRDTCTFPKPEGGIWHCEEYR
ncbi:MAG: hypothetical protein KAT48_13160 [Bacteroidales bacterium]|jgi:hypothetical protein|nr:hypothetical protein [Bacteroidales bacterium]